MAITVKIGQRKWFKNVLHLPHRGYLPSLGGLPEDIADEECAARWGDRKGKNRFHISKDYINYKALKRRYEEVHQWPLGRSLPLYLALGWVAEEKWGMYMIDWATFARWRANDHDGPLEELQERAEQLAKEERKGIALDLPKPRGRPGRTAREKGTATTNGEEGESSRGLDISLLPEENMARVCPGNA